MRRIMRSTNRTLRGYDSDVNEQVEYSAKATLSPRFIYFKNGSKLDLANLQTKTLDIFYNTINNKEADNQEINFKKLKINNQTQTKKQHKKVLVTEFDALAFLAQQLFYQDWKLIEVNKKVQLDLKQHILPTKEQIASAEKQNIKSLIKYYKLIIQVQKEQQILNKLQNIKRNTERLILEQRLVNKSVINFLEVEILKYERIVFVDSIFGVQKLQEVPELNPYLNRELSNLFTTLSVKLEQTSYNPTAYVRKYQQHILKRVNYQYNSYMKQQTQTQQDYLTSRSTTINQNSPMLPLTFESQQVVRVILEPCYPSFLMKSVQLRSIVGSQRLSNMVSTWNQAASWSHLGTQVSDQSSLSQQWPPNPFNQSTNILLLKYMCHYCMKIFRGSPKYICTNKNIQANSVISSLIEPYYYLYFHINSRARDVQKSKNFIQNCFVHPYFKYYQCRPKDYVCNRTCCQWCYKELFKAKNSGLAQIQNTRPFVCSFCHKNCCCSRCRHMEKIVRMMAYYLQHISQQKIIKQSGCLQNNQQKSTIIEGLNKVVQLMVFPNKPFTGIIEQEKAHIHSNSLQIPNQNQKIAFKSMLPRKKIKGVQNQINLLQFQQSNKTILERNCQQ